MDNGQVILLQVNLNSLRDFMVVLLKEQPGE